MSNPNDFVVENGVLKKYKGTDSDVVIPEGVTCIGDSAFSLCSELESITVPDSVTKVGVAPFRTFKSKLKTVNASDSVFDLLWGELNSEQRFEVAYSNMKSGVVANVVKLYIRKKKAKFLEAIIKNDDAEAIAGFLSCFKKTDIGEIDDYIQKAGSAVNVKAFLVDYRGKNFSVPESEDYYSAQTDKELGLKARTLADWRKIFKIDLSGNLGAYITGYKSEDPIVLIPSKVGNNAVYGIERNAFRRNKVITKVIIESGIKIVWSEAFNGCTSLETIVIPESVNRIGKDVFKNTAYFKDKANWDNNVLYLDNCLIKAKPALRGEYTIKNGTRVIAGSAFEGCDKLTGIMLPDGVETIDNNAFSGCSNLINIYIPASVIKIGTPADRVSINTRFDPRAFIGCDKFTIHAPAGSYAEQYAKENGIPFVAE